MHCPLTSDPVQTIFRLGLLAFAAAGLAAEPVKSRPQLPGLQLDGSVLLPNQWSLRPVGRQVVVGDFPVNLAVHPASHYVAVLHAGYSQHEVRILDATTGAPVSQVALEETFYGLAWSTDGARLFCSGAGAEVIHEYTFREGFLSNHREVRLRPAEEEGIPAGLAPSRDGSSLYIAETWGQRIEKLDTKTNKLIWVRSLSAASGPAETKPEGERFKTVLGPDAAFPYTCLPDEARNRVYVSLWAGASVLSLDAKTGAEIARWSVGDHPNEMLLSSDGRLFVAEANLNTVSVIDVKTGRLSERLSASLRPNSPPGSTPNSLALSPDGSLLYVANATNNAIAVFDVSSAGKAVSLGFIPVGWYPTSVRASADGKKLFVANGKGATSAANPAGPFPGDMRPRNLQEYIGSLLKGTVSVIDLPKPDERAARFGEWSKIALSTMPAAPALSRQPGHPVPAGAGEASPIRYCIYVVKENRTYDQVFGDMAEGNGDPRLCLFPEAITPNQHALAREFVLLDNFYCEGEVSADGHEWTMGAYATDFVEKTWPLNYGHNEKNKYEYPSEGRYPITQPAGGYLWNRAAEAGLSYRSYGEFCQSSKRKDVLAIASLPVLEGHIDSMYAPYNIDIRDVTRAERFISELKRFESEGEMPKLQVVRLGNDHTAGTKPGKRTPTAMVADNDLALGRLVEAVSQSKFWNETAIFVVEDDAQNGPDHVDAHRTVALVISPHVARRTVDSTMYSTSSMLRTMELILGLAPMSQYDATATPMVASFSSKSENSGYTARTPQADLNATNSAQAWGARQSKKMDFREADRVDDLLLNEVVWRSVRGGHSPMPAPVRAAFLKTERKRSGDDN